MEKLLCKYHQASPIWHCADCHSYFCSRCIPGSSDNYYKGKPRCVLCQGFLTFEGGAHTAEPFWKRAADFFRYPFHKNGLITLATLMFALAIVSALPLTTILLMLIFAGVFRYGLLIMQDCMDGNFSPPRSSELFNKDEDHLFLKFIAIMICYGIGIGFLTGISVTLAQIAGFFLPLIIPANTILLAADKRFLTAINPLKILWLISTIGAPYFLLGLLVMLISNSPYYFIMIFAKWIPDWLMLAVTGTASAYFSFVACAMMGYTVYQYQRELGYSSSNDEEYYLEPKDFDKKRALATIHIFIQEGRYKEAREQLSHALQEDRENIELHDILHRLLLATNDIETLQDHTHHCAELFSRKGYAGKAASYYLDTQNKVSDFQLDKPDISLKVAELLFNQGKHKQALLLLKNLHKRFPEYGLIFNAYFLAARIYAEGLHDDVNALKLLNFLAGNFKMNTRLHEMEAYRSKLAATNK